MHTRSFYQSSLRTQLPDNIGYFIREQQTKMYRTIKDEIINTDQHEHLIWKVLIPQWALEIFKTKFGLSQDDALRQIKIQDAAEIQNQSNFDFEL